MYDDVLTLLLKRIVYYKDGHLNEGIVTRIRLEVEPRHEIITGIEVAGTKTLINATSVKAVKC